MSAGSLILALLLGLGLSASSGLNTFLPLLLLGAAARFHVAGIELGGKFAWLTSDVALVILIVACIVEIVADKVPAVDHFLDAVGTIVRPAAGAVAAAAVLVDLDPVVAAVVGIIMGGPVALGVHTLKSGTRVASTATTFGCANPILSLIEDILAFILSLLAIFAPIVVPIALAVLVLVLWRVFSRVRRATATAPAAR